MCTVFFGMKTKRFDLMPVTVFLRVLVNIFLVWVVAGVEVTRACAWCEVDCISLPVAVTLLIQDGAFSQVARADTMKAGWAQAGTILFKCMYFLPWSLCPKEVVK